MQNKIAIHCFLPSYINQTLHHLEISLNLESYLRENYHMVSWEKSKVKKVIGSYYVLKLDYFSDSQVLDSKFANSNKITFQNWMSSDEDDVFIQFDNFIFTNSVHK